MTNATMTGFETMTNVRLDRLEAEALDIIDGMEATDENLPSHARWCERLDAIQAEKSRRSDACLAHLRADLRRTDEDECRTCGQPVTVGEHMAHRGTCDTCHEQADTDDTDDATAEHSLTMFEIHIAGLSDEDLVNVNHTIPRMSDPEEMLVMVIELRHRLARHLGMTDGPND